MSTTNEFSRLAVTAADTDGSLIPQWPMVGYVRARIGVLGTVASSTLKGRFITFNSTGAVVGVSPQYTFTCAATSDYGGTSFLGTPSADAFLMLSGAYRLAFIVDAVTGTSASFTLSVRAENVNLPQ